MARGTGRRKIARRLGLDPKTVRRYLRAAECCGLRAGSGPAALSEAQVTAVITALRPGGERPYGEGWQTCEAHRAFIGVARGRRTPWRSSRGRILERRTPARSRSWTRTSPR